MRKKTPLAVAIAFAMSTFLVLSGCGASLDREVTLHDMTLKVPGNWLQSPEIDGVVSFVEENDDLDEDETANSIVIGYREFADESQGESTKQDTAKAPTQMSDLVPEGADNAAAVKDTTGPNRDLESPQESIETDSNIPVFVRTASEAIAAKQQRLEQEYGITAWAIDKEKSQVIDGAQVTTYEYSFVKDIAGEKRTYEFQCAYVVTTEAIYEIALTGDGVDINGLVGSIEF